MDGGAFCQLIGGIQQEAGLLALLFLVGAALNAYVWERAWKLKDWFDKLSNAEKQGIVAAGGFVIVLAAKLLDVYVCLAPMPVWLDTLVEIGAMVAAMFGLSSVIHRADVKFIQKR